MLICFNSALQERYASIVSPTETDWPIIEGDSVVALLHHAKHGDFIEGYSAAFPQYRSIHMQHRQCH